jgi:spore germination cell wall hydrolase CwlJ-like protein
LSSKSLILAILAIVALLAPASAAVTDARSGVDLQRIAREAGDFGPRSFARLSDQLSSAELALTKRFEPGKHADLWGRPPAWPALRLDQPPALPLKTLSQAEAARINAVMPAELAALTPAPAFILTGRPAEQARAQLCLAQAIYYEAALEPPEGQAAVAQTVLNRVRHPDFPKTVCGVVYQGASQPGCQFSFACDGSRDRAPIEPYWGRARQVAAAALGGKVEKGVGTATYYHADYVFPVWSPQLVKIGRFGSQIFYRYPGPQGGAGALTGRYGGGELAVSMAGPPRALLQAKSGAGGPPPTGVIMTGATTGPDGRQRIRGELVFGRRIPTKAEIAAINAQIAAMDAAAAKARSSDHAADARPSQPRAPHARAAAGELTQRSAPAEARSWPSR